MNLRLYRFKLWSSPKSESEELDLLQPRNFSEVTYASNLPVDQALAKVVHYQELWNIHSSFYELSHALFSIQDIPDEAYFVLSKVNVEMIEDLPSTPEELDI